MSDAKLRELEATYRRSGATEDAVAWLAERLRAGELEPTRVELAAWLGHPAAASLALDPAPEGFHAPPRVDPNDEGPAHVHYPVDWLDRVQALEPQAALRVTLAALQAVVTWPLSPTLPAIPSPLEVAEDYALCPCARHERIAGALYDALEAFEDGDPHSLLLDVETALVLCTEDGSRAPASYPTAQERLARAVATGASHRAQHVTFAAITLANLLRDASTRGRDPAAVDATVREELSAWLLGLRDPVAERVNAR